MNTTETENQTVDTAAKTLEFLESVHRLIAKHPALAGHGPRLCPEKNEILYYRSWENADLLALDFDWQEEQPDIEEPDVDAVANMDGIILRLRAVRQLQLSKPELEPFIPRDLKPEHKEFVEEMK